MVDIRRAGRSDVAAVTRLLSALRDTAWERLALSPEYVSAYVGRSACWADVAVDRGRVVGVALGMNRRLVALFVDEAYRNRGIGRRLVAGSPGGYATVPLRVETVPVLLWLSAHAGFLQSSALADDSIYIAKPGRIECPSPRPLPPTRLSWPSSRTFT